MLSSMIILFASLLGIDEVIKQQVEERMDPGEERELAGGKVVIRKVYNRGFMMNFLEDKPKIVRGVTIGAGIAILIGDILAFLPVRISRNICADRKARLRLCHVKKGQYIRQFGITLLSAGAASNMFDRLVRGRVIDYIGFHTGKKFPDGITANLGDLYIACGAVLLMVREFCLGAVKK